MSGNVNVGFIDGRVSSRVLKPPGGGYSDIFNFSQNEEESPKKPPPPVRIQTNIESIICTEQKTDKEVVTAAGDVVIEEKIEKLTLTEEAENSSAAKEAIKSEEVIVQVVKEEEETAKTPEVTPTRKGRVPPGGFSSGLW